MSLPLYPAYKDNGVGWLGAIPTSWRTVPLWTLFRRAKRTGFQSEQLLSVYREFGVIPKASRDDNNNRASDDLSVYQLVKPGDLAVNKMKAWQGSVGVSTHRGIVSPAYFIYEAAHEENARYLHYLLRSPRYVTGYLSLSKGIRVNQWDLEPQYHSRMPVVLPSSDEQAAIATFLDRETTKIDALIAEQEKLIALLAEKRQATISRSVTRGLDPDAPMKDSGVPWLGDVPAHWRLTRLKYVTDAVVDCPHETPIYDEEGPYRVIRTADISDGRLHLEAMYSVCEEEFLRRIRRMPLNEGDVVYGREGERWGFAAQVPESNAYCLGQRMMQFRAAARMHPRFLMWQLNAQSTYRQGDVDTVGATSPHVNVGVIRNYALSEPPATEQREISDFLDSETAKLDVLGAEAERMILLLRERRSVLIAAAVTGQLDVRGVISRPAPEEAVAA
jgi:type I restriction enzyme, S subunit